MSGGRVENKAKSISCVRSLIGNIFGGVGDVVIEGIKKIFGIDVGLDTSNFDKNLNNTITDCQKLADAVDELVIPDAQIQSDWNQSNNTLKDYIKNKPLIPTADSPFLDVTNFDNNLAKTVTTVQILADRVDDFLLQSDWNQTDNQIEDYIKNKPTIPDAQIQSDWNQTDNTLKDFIKNKPTIPDAGILDLGSLLTANATFKGVVINGDIDSFTCNAGDLMQMQASGLYIGANATSVNRTYMLAIATATGNTSTIPLLTYGQFCLTSWNWTPNLPLYVSLDSGIMTQTPPMSDVSEINVCVGFALSADTIFFNPYIDWDQIAGDVLIDNSALGSGNLTAGCANVQDLVNEVDALELSGGGSAALVNVEDVNSSITLSPTDKHYQFLKAQTAIYDVNLPNAGFAEGASFTIINTQAHYNPMSFILQFNGVSQCNVYNGSVTKVVFTGTKWVFANEMWKTDTYMQTDGLSIGRGANGYCGGTSIGHGSLGGLFGVAVGYNSSNKNKNGAIALGVESKCERIGEFWISADKVAVNKKGRGQVSWFGTTTNATQTEIFIDGYSNAQYRMNILAKSVVNFKIDVTAIKSDGSQGAGYKIEGVIRRDGANNTVFVGTPVVTVLGEDDASWDVVVEADNTNEALVVKVTGAAATSITWHAAGYFTEVRI